MLRPITDDVDRKIRRRRNNSIICVSRSEKVTLHTFLSLVIGVLMQILLLSIEKTSAGMLFFDKTTPHNYSFYEERHIIIILLAPGENLDRLWQLFLWGMFRCVRTSGCDYVGEYKKNTQICKSPFSVSANVFSFAHRLNAAAYNRKVFFFSLAEDIPIW